MITYRDVAELARAAASFGPGSAEKKLRLLAKVAGDSSASGRSLRMIQDVLCFLRAYPDDPRVLKEVAASVRGLRSGVLGAGVDPEAGAFDDEGFPGSVTRCTFSLPVSRRLSRAHPGCLDIDWNEFDEQGTLLHVLALVVTSAECQGLDDIEIDLPSWFEACRSTRHQTDLDFLIDLFDRSALDPEARDATWETCAVPVRYTLAEPGTARCEITDTVTRTYYQRRPLERTIPEIRRVIRRRPARMRRLGAAGGDRTIDLALRTLCARGLEIRSLSYANPDDVTRVDCGRGLQIALLGVLPSYRDPLESHYCCLVLKNGIPIAYGPGTVSLGCCEIGLNLFPEFRGAEVRFVYPQFMRTLHHVLGADYFFLTAYGMGKENPAAIKTGAFWFYRKLGFRPTRDGVEQMARAEEDRMADDRSYRSSPARLRTLSHSSVFLDLSRGSCRPLDLGGIGIEHSRYVTSRYGGDRGRAVRSSMSTVARALGVSLRGLDPARRRAWEMLAPLLVMIPDLDRWRSRERGALRRILEAKGGRSEVRVDTMIRTHPRLPAALRALEPRSQEQG